MKKLTYTPPHRRKLKSEWYDGTKSESDPPKSWIEAVIHGATLYDYFMTHYPVKGKPYHMSYVEPARAKRMALAELEELRSVGKRRQSAE